MNPKRIIMVGTMAFVITCGTGTLVPADKANASARTNQSKAVNPHVSVHDEFLRALGASSDEEVYDAVYNGQSLADIARSNHADVRNIIELQVAQLTAQLDARLASGSISPRVHEAQKSEVPTIVANSVFGFGVTRDDNPER